MGPVTPPNAIQSFLVLSDGGQCRAAYRDARRIALDEAALGRARGVDVTGVASRDGRASRGGNG